MIIKSDNKNSKYLKISQKLNKIKTKKKRLIKNNKCIVKKSTLKALPLSYFKSLANNIMNIMNKLQDNSNETKHACVALLKQFPFCITDTEFDFDILKNIFKNTEFTKTEKKRRIISALINMAWQHITTHNADIGVLQDLDNYCRVKTCRPIKEEYEYYINAHNLDEERYSYM